MTTMTSATTFKAPGTVVAGRIATQEPGTRGSHALWMGLHWKIETNASIICVARMKAAIAHRIIVKRLTVLKIR